MEPLKTTDDNAKPRFMCPDCYREFGNMGALKSHIRTHDEEPQSQVIDLPEFPKDDLEILENPGRALMAAIERAKPVPPIVVKVKKLPHGLDLPDLKRGTAGAAAVDLYAAIDEDFFWLGAQTQAMPPVPTGIAVEIPEGYVGKVVPRSGLAAKHGISIVNSPGIIDCDYRGEIMITLINTSQHKCKISRGDRIAQMLIEKVEPVQFQYVTELSNTVRGEGGFGSTGVSQEIKGTPMTVIPGKTINFAETAQEPDGKTVRKLPPTHDLRRNEV